VYVPEGSWQDPDNYSGTPLHLGRALAASCERLGLELRVVETPEMLNTEPLWELTAACLEGAPARERVVRSLPLRQRQAAQTTELLASLAPARGWGDVMGVVVAYLESFQDLTRRRLQREMTEGACLLSLNTLNPLWRGWFPAYYYLDTPLAPFYFDGQTGLIPQARTCPELARVFVELERRALAQARGLFFFSDFAAQLCRRAYPRVNVPIEVVGAGVNFEEPPPFRVRAFGRPLRLLFVGRNFAVKGGPLLLEAAGKLDPTCFSLTVVTDERFHPPPSAPVSAGVRFLPPQPKGALRELYHQHDVFLFPTTHDAFGLAACEAMASGMPVLATPVRAMPDILGPASDLLDPFISTADGLVSKLEDLADDPERLRAVGRRNHLRASLLHDWRAVVSRLLSAVIEGRGVTARGLDNAEPLESCA
jgi:glycosyltransferase involved in cell wall biosynthesis